MNELAIFAKYWEPGRAKTRLAAALGHAAASRLSRAFLVALLQRLAGTAERSVLAYTPTERRDEFASLAGHLWSLRPQGDGDLGARLQRCFEAAFQTGAQRAVVIGGDSPTLPTAYVVQAFDALQRSPVVLGPTSDGGYYLVGATGEPPPIFTGVTWGSPLVWQQTVAQLARVRRPFHTLPAWYDVDQVGDLIRLRQELERAETLDAALQELWPEVRTALSGHQSDPP
jgi:uncharacterized protein